MMGERGGIRTKDDGRERRETGKDDSFQEPVASNCFTWAGDSAKLGTCFPL